MTVVNLELDEMLELENQFENDLELVFQGKQLEFSDHLRGMLLELWLQARAIPSVAVQELEELRKLKAENLELKNMVEEIVRAEFPNLIRDKLPVFSEQFRVVVETVFSSEFRPQLVKELTNYNHALDSALSQSLFRVINPTGGLETGMAGDRFELSVGSAGLNPGLPPFQAPSDGFSVDPTQENLRARLEWEGILTDTSVDKDWIPVRYNLKTGSLSAFQHENSLTTRYPIGREIRVRLAWNGVSWIFPNPVPTGTWTDDHKHIQILVNGTIQEAYERPSWIWDSRYQVNTSRYEFTGIRAISAAFHGTEIVEAVYRVPDE